MARPAARVESRWSVEPDGIVRRVDAVQTGVEAAFPAEPVPGLDARTRAAVSAPAVTVADVARPACPGSSDAAANRVDEAVARHQVERAKACVQSQALPAWRRQREAPAAARYAAVSPAGASLVRAAVQVAASYLAPRCEAGSLVEQTVLPAAMLAQQALRRRVRVALRLSPRQPVVLRRGRVRKRSRPEVLHRQQQEVVVRLRQWVGVRRSRPVPRLARVRRPAALAQEPLQQTRRSPPPVRAA
jgi:hypothetical protein